MGLNTHIFIKTEAKVKQRLPFMSSRISLGPRIYKQTVVQYKRPYTVSTS